MKQIPSYFESHNYDLKKNTDWKDYFVKQLIGIILALCSVSLFFAIGFSVGVGHRLSQCTSKHFVHKHKE